MCTAATYTGKDHYFGRNLDLELSYNESVTVTPRKFPLKFHQVHDMNEHFAIIVDDITGQVTAVNKALPACLDKSWQQQTAIVNAVLQHTGGMGFSLSAAMLLALAKGGAA